MGYNLQSVLDFFGLERRPFALAPDPDFLFRSPQHMRVQAILDYGLLSSAPITLVTGEIGAGKTILLRDLLARPSDELKIGLIANAAPADRVEMLRLILFALGQTPPETNSYASLYAQLEQLLVEEYREGRRVVLVFDEAQNLDRDSLEHLRMLTNINYSHHELVQLLLIGQPELLDMINRADLKQLAQRISANCFLPSLSEEDVGAYIAHRLEVAGAQRELFEPEAIKLIFERTGGTPRLVNQVCDYALLYAFGNGEETVGLATLNKVFEDDFMISLARERPLRVVNNGFADKATSGQDTKS